MDQNLCTICQKNNTTGDRILIIASFGQNYRAKDAMQIIESAHIIPAWMQIFSKEQVEKIAMLHAFPTLIIELHGIKDIMQLQSLFIESICRENNALTVDVIVAGKSREKIIAALS